MVPRVHLEGVTVAAGRLGSFFPSGATFIGCGEYVSQKSLLCDKLWRELE